MEGKVLNIKLATRKSKLAQVQTEYTMKLLKDNFDLESEKLLIVTEGDRRLDVTLSKIGGKGVFVKEIELALINEEADAAIHSMKDVPFEMDEVFELAAMPEREDVRDVFIGNKGIHFNELPQGAVIGTSSLRREKQLKMLRPDIKTVPIRGNVQTRLKKIETENLHGIILAAAGLKRLRMEDVITDYFHPMDMVPAIGQGALGIQVVSKSKNADIFRKLDNNKVRICVEAERAYMRELNGGCHICIGAHATLHGDKMNIIGIFELNGEVVKKQISGSKDNGKELGRELARKILEG